MSSIKHLKVNSPNVQYGEGEINSTYSYTSEIATVDGDTVTVTPQETKYEFKTATNVGKVGLMLVGWGGNNGSTVTGSQIANREGITWETRNGTQAPNYFGSLTQASTLRMGRDANGDDVYVPFSRVLPMVHPNDIVISGWDISSMNLADCLDRSRVFEPDLIRQLKPKMQKLVPLPSIYYPDFIAANQSDRADNILPGNDKAEHLETIRKNIRDFKSKHDLNSVIVLWTANTERFADIIEGVNDTEENLMQSVKESHPEIAPSTIFAIASILEGAPFINGSPQNTFVPGVVQLAESKRSFIAGDDFKSGQTKMKSVLVDFLVGAGIKPISITSYNHLGNNDGKNLSAPSQFRSKEISKSNVVDDMVASNEILYAPGEHPDHVVVIKYVPAVGDSKRALDEYVSEIFMGGRNTISMHNTCEDSLLASPLIFDLAILAEFCTRVRFRKNGEGDFEHFHSILSLLSYLLKAPLVKPGTPVVNALASQRSALENVMRACVGLPPQNDMLLEDRICD